MEFLCQPSGVCRPSFPRVVTDCDMIPVAPHNEVRQVHPWPILGRPGVLRRALSPFTLRWSLDKGKFMLRFFSVH
jgi:hypothetical protein